MKKGFTLIELMVVVLIIGILSAVALPEYTLAVERSRSAEALVNGKAVVDSVQRYKQMYPNDTVSRAEQLADVTLTGGSTSTWDANDEFTTTNFVYEIISDGVRATRRKEEGNQPIYTLIFTYDSQSEQIKMNCSSLSDYSRICKAINKLYTIPT